MGTRPEMLKVCTYAAAASQAASTAWTCSSVGWAGRVPENRAAIRVRRSLVSMSSNAGSVLVRYQGCAARRSSMSAGSWRCRAYQMTIRVCTSIANGTVRSTASLTRLRASPAPRQPPVHLLHHHRQGVPDLRPRRAGVTRTAGRIGQVSAAPRGTRPAHQRSRSGPAPRPASAPTPDAPAGLPACGPRTAPARNGPPSASPYARPSPRSAPSTAGPKSSPSSSPGGASAPRSPPRNPAFSASSASTRTAKTATSPASSSYEGEGWAPAGTTTMIDDQGRKIKSGTPPRNLPSPASLKHPAQPTP